MPTFDLARFDTAQSDTKLTTFKECWAGKRQPHWMQFVFPQVSGLGLSDMSVR
jgi:uncharacterized protein (DUF1810 family)